jgi:protein TonB
VTLSIRERPTVSRHAATTRGCRTTSVAAALLLHAVALTALIVLPPRPLDEDKAPQAEVVTLLFEPPAAEEPAETPPPDAQPEPPPAATVVPPELPPPPPEPPTPETVIPVPDIPPPPPAVAKPRPPRRRPATPAPTAEPHASSAEPRPPVAAAPSEDIIGPYRNSLAAHLRPYQHYPLLARSRHEEGLVIVHVTIQRDGHIAAMSIEHGSGFEALDREALATLKRADPLPPVPAGVPGTTMELSFPLRFQME